MKKPLLGKDISYYQDKNWYRYIPSDNKFIHYNLKKIKGSSQEPCFGVSLVSSER
jgi:hypothetical protein